MMRVNVIESQISYCTLPYSMAAHFDLHCHLGKKLIVDAVL